MRWWEAACEGVSKLVGRGGLGGGGERGLRRFGRKGSRLRSGSCPSYIG
jgi:hypothetical protein